MYFLQDWRERIKQENPEASFGELGRLLGDKWKELDDDKKKPYMEQAARDKVRAEQEKKEYENKIAVHHSQCKGLLGHDSVTGG